MPSHLKLQVLMDCQYAIKAIADKQDQSAVAAVQKQSMKPADWEEVKWIRSICTVPLIAKGIMNAQDAVRAYEAGFNAIWLSNHGGRQCDNILAPINVLEDVVKELKGKCEIYVDGGVRRGSDIFKAIAMGATCVFVGKPAIFSLACKGAEGVEQMIDILREEFKKTMQLCGVDDVAKINKSYLVPKHKLASQLPQPKL